MQVSRLTYAASRCGEAATLCKKSSEPIQKQFRAAYERCADAHARAKKDNDLVYTERVPAIATLPKLERACLVKKLRLPELDVAEPMDDTPTVVPPPSAPPPSAQPPAAPAAETAPPPNVPPMGGMLGALFGGGKKEPAKKSEHPAPPAAARQPSSGDAPASAVASLSLDPPPPSFEEAQSMPPPPSYNEAQEAMETGVDTLVSMGFARADARRALSEANGSVERAAEMLL